MTNTPPAPSGGEETRLQAAYGNDGVMVTMTDTLGTVFLGFAALGLLIALLHAQACIRKLQIQIHSR